MEIMKNLTIKNSKSRNYT